MTMTGTAWAARRRRSEGPLDAGEVALARAQGVALAYDAAQAGWVPAGCRDDLAPPALEPAIHETGPPALAFRPWAAQDAPLYRALLDDPAVWRFLPEDHRPLSEEDARALIALSAAPHHTVRAVLAAGEPVGQVRLLWTGEGEAELSYWLGRRHWGRGLGSALVEEAVAWAFAGHPALRILTARVHEGNPASSRALRKAGFAAVQREGEWLWLRRLRPVRATQPGEARPRLS
jgi:RimJ/RimL family protein N-acetyltransferase